jgi:hypothetical protein
MGHWRAAVLMARAPRATDSAADRTRRRRRVDAWIARNTVGFLAAIDTLLAAAPDLAFNASNLEWLDTLAEEATEARTITHERWNTAKILAVAFDEIDRELAGSSTSLPLATLWNKSVEL